MASSFIKFGFKSLSWMDFDVLVGRAICSYVQCLLFLIRPTLIVPVAYFSFANLTLYLTLAEFIQHSMF